MPTTSIKLAIPPRPQFPLSSYIHQSQEQDQNSERKTISERWINGWSVQVQNSTVTPVWMTKSQRRRPFWSFTTLRPFTATASISWPITPSLMFFSHFRIVCSVESSISLSLSLSFQTYPEKNQRACQTTLPCYRGQLQIIWLWSHYHMFLYLSIRPCATCVNQSSYCFFSILFTSCRLTCLRSGSLRSNKNFLRLEFFFSGIFEVGNFRCNHV